MRYDLVKIEDWIENKIVNLTIHPNKADPWIGLKRKSQNSFQWTDGTALEKDGKKDHWTGYENWKPKEPNNNVNY